MPTGEKTRLILLLRQRESRFGRRRGHLVLKSGSFIATALQHRRAYRQSTLTKFRARRRIQKGCFTRLDGRVR